MGVTLTTQLYTRVPEDLVKQLEAIAKADDRTVSYIVRQALKAYVEQEKQAA